MRLRTGLLVFLLFSLILLSSIQEAGAEKYTRERSESLFHLISWREYAPATFSAALEEQKPIFLLISAPSWCYWCHVYESEDYLYHPQLYPYINEHFIPVFVDSDKRPDLTRKYLEGGWPSTTIFAPNMERINGFVGPRDPVTLRGYLEQVVAYLNTTTYSSRTQPPQYERTEPVIPQRVQVEQIDRLFRQYAEQSFDPVYGGFLPGARPDWRKGQKFPRGLTLASLLQAYEQTGNKQYLDMVRTTFENQYTSPADLTTRYHLYDPVEGGFHRYSTKTDWTTPHYEKMLYDQAKLLRAYSRLAAITNETRVQEAVERTVSYVLSRLHGPDGGFYSSQDSYLEEEYYGLPREGRERLEPPHIDTTRRTDGTAMMVSTLLTMDRYEKAATDGLSFLKDRMLGPHGMYTYSDGNRAFLTGQSVANAWGLLAFVEGYDLTGNESYRAAAEQVAAYSLNRLYDWNAGGFFERNSEDTRFYAPNEQVDLSKPFQENAVFSYALLKLYTMTRNLSYLESGMKTLGYLLQRARGLDEMYYVLQASRLVRENRLLEEYERNTAPLTLLVEGRQESFFLPTLFERGDDQAGPRDAPQLQDGFATAGFLVLALLAFAAGILSFLSPCCLPVLSAYFAQGATAGKGRVLRNTLFFLLGLAVVFSLYGMGATLVGGLLRGQRLLLTRAAGAAIIVLGIMELSGRGFSGPHLHTRHTERTTLGSLLFGAVFALGWSACIGPILASLLLLSATTGTVIKGSTLLFIYALGLGLPLIIISFFFDRIHSGRLWKALKGTTLSFTLFGHRITVHTTSLLSGTILLVLGVLTFNDYLYKLNQYALQTQFVQDVIIKGEEFLKSLVG